MNRKLVILFLIATTVYTAAFLGFGDKKKGALATVENQKITVQDLQNKLKTYPENLQSALQQKENKVKVLDQMIDELVLVMAAKKEGYSNSTEFKTQMADAERQVLISMLVRDKIDNKVTVTEDDLRKYYESNQAQFGEIERRRVRHILVKDEKAAENILKRLRAKGGAGFEDIAKKESIDPSAQSGGDLGWFTRGQLVPEFEKAAFELRGKGSLSGVVRTQFGFHVIQLVDANVRPKLNFNDVRNQIQQAVISEKKRQLTNDLLGKMKEKYKVTRNLALLDAPAAVPSAKK